MCRTMRKRSPKNPLVKASQNLKKKATGNSHLLVRQPWKKLTQHGLRKQPKKKKLKKETAAKALEIIEDRRLQTTAEDDKLDHVLYELEKIKKHVSATKETVPQELKPPPLRRSRKKAPPPPPVKSAAPKPAITSEVKTAKNQK